MVQVVIALYYPEEFRKKEKFEIRRVKIKLDQPGQTAIGIQWLSIIGPIQDLAKTEALCRIQNLDFMPCLLDVFKTISFVCNILCSVFCAFLPSKLL